MIIGITGYNASGKDSMADYLVSKGFVHYSLSDIIREELRKKKKKITRENLIDLGNELRSKYGASVLAKKVSEKIKKGQNYVITSIRNKEEVKELEKLEGFVLVHVYSDVKIRFERIKKRGNEKDAVKSVKELIEKEKLEESSEDDKQQLHIVSKMAKVVIRNEGSLEEFYKKIDRFLVDFGTKKRTDYISWDVYFMGIALLSAQRSKDPSTQVGACIVDKKNKIVGIGYNGFPIGCSDDELPWGRGEGLDSKYWYVVHAEANAILNSGRDLDGAKIYVALFPCNECAKLIIQSGIKEIIYLSDKYKDSNAVKASKKMLKMAGVKFRRLKDFPEKLVIDFYNYWLVNMIERFINGSLEK